MLNFPRLLGSCLKMRVIQNLQTPRLLRWLILSWFQCTVVLFWVMWKPPQWCYGYHLWYPKELLGVHWSRAMVNLVIDHKNVTNCNPMQFKFWKLEKFVETFPITKNQHASWEMAIGAFGADFTKACWLQEENIDRTVKLSCRLVFFILTLL